MDVKLASTKGAALLLTVLRQYLITAYELKECYNKLADVIEDIIKKAIPNLAPP